MVNPDPGSARSPGYASLFLELLDFGAKQLLKRGQREKLWP